MAAKTASDGSLSDTFNKVNHWRHVLMDISMIGMAIGAIVATGGSAGFLDPLLGWAKMHFSGIPDVLMSGPEFLTDAFEQASNGTWFTGLETDMHSGHVMDVVPSEPVLSDSAKKILGME